MKVDDVLKHYKNAYQFNKQSQMSLNNIRNWRERGYIPIASQMRLEKLTNGALKADMTHAVKDAE